MKRIIIIASFLISMQAFSQVRVQFELDMGIGFQPEIELDNQLLKSTETFVTRFGSNLQIPVYKKFYTEIGLFGIYNYGGDEIEQVEFKSHNLSMQIPIYIGYEINKKWQANIGLGFENIRDFEDFDFREKYNIGFDFLTKVIYRHTDQLHFTLNTYWTLSSIPTTYDLYKPENGVLLGVIYQLKKNEEVKSKKKNDE